MKNLEEESRHFRSHAGAVVQLEALAQSGDALTYIKKMKAIRDQLKACKCLRCVLKGMCNGK